MEKTSPLSEDEWTIHSLNIHGIFFERWCAAEIGNGHLFTVESTNYPVEFPMPFQGIRGKESNLDIRAYAYDGTVQLTLVIECKKNNPEFVNWIFFPHRKRYQGDLFEISRMFNRKDSGNDGWVIDTDIAKLYFENISKTDEARETRGSYKDYKNNATKTKTSNSSISDAAYQVAIAAQSILVEEVLRHKHGNQNWQYHLILPVIVTSARLFTCNFQPKDVDKNTGEILAKKTSLEEQPYLIFEYALPRHLQALKDEHRELPLRKLESYMRMQIMVVHSAKLQEFLKMIREKLPDMKY